MTELLRGEDFVTAAEVENMQYDMPTEGYEDPLVRVLRLDISSSRGGLTGALPPYRSTSTCGLCRVLV